MARPALTVRRRAPSVVAAVLVAASGALIGVLAYQSPASSASAAAATFRLHPTEHPMPLPGGAGSHPPGEGTLPRGEPRARLGEADGAIPAGTTVWDDELPGVANLDPALLAALRQAATAAARDGITFFVDSGWRSPEYQERLLREAIATYGSAEEAARWVATPTESSHVSGNAADIGQSDATGWLSAHGSEYGLCQIYRNEPWHYELRPEATDLGCPQMYADPAHDPRMQR